MKLFSKEEALATADGLLDRIEKVRAAREEAKKQSEAGNGDEMAEGTFRSRPFLPIRRRRRNFRRDTDVRNEKQYIRSQAVRCGHIWVLIRAVRRQNLSC